VKSVKSISLTWVQCLSRRTCELDSQEVRSLWKRHDHISHWKIQVNWNELNDLNCSRSLYCTTQPRLLQVLFSWPFIICAGVDGPLFALIFFNNCEMLGSLSLGPSLYALACCFLFLWCEPLHIFITRNPILLLWYNLSVVSSGNRH